MEKLGYLLTYGIAFLFVAAAMYILNLRYNNIFQLDFTPTPNVQRINYELGQKVDSLKNYYKKTRIDTFFVYQDTTLINKIKILEAENNNLKNIVVSKENLIKEKDKRIKLITDNKAKSKDSTYFAWLKATVKLYETMDSQKAATIIKDYPIDKAKDIIYKMKKKKAGEILSLLAPDKVTQITGVK